METMHAGSKSIAPFSSKDVSRYLAENEMGASVCSGGKVASFGNHKLIRENTKFPVEKRSLALILFSIRYITDTSVKPCSNEL
jgi:hypothetical protein